MFGYLFYGCDPHPSGCWIASPSNCAETSKKMAQNFVFGAESAIEIGSLVCGDR